MCPVVFSWGTHVSTEVVYGSRYVWSGTVRAVNEFYDESWKRELIRVQGLVGVGHDELFGCHRGADG